MVVVSSKSQGPVAPSAPALMAHRYQRVADLGGGGIAQVYAVLDTTNGRKVALKRPTLQGSAEHRRRVVDLFAREFHALSQLAHPRIVEVYDYGVDEHGPYYTMEILDGGDLQQLVPLDYRRLCQIARDVCSALSLLHSRRIVHRDLSPRNVRCTSAGVAKLIDFGAMAPMGPSKELVGTPAFCAPEVVNMQALDARTDLYALGATLYYALTDHYPYPARDFGSLQNAWRFALVRPSEIVSDVPEALDALVLDLLQLDPNARPSSAAEVIERLNAIDGRPANDHSAEQLVVAQSYLATPTFVGRRDELSRVQSRTRRALRKHGAVIFVSGAQGAGRSRFLEACLLDAKLQGYTCLRADADDGSRGDYGVLQRLIGQLQQFQPELSRALVAAELPVLSRVMPELFGGERLSLPPLAQPGSLRVAVQAATQRVLLATAERTPLFIAIDDIQASDEPSVAALALLARAAERARIVMVASTVDDELAKYTAMFKLLTNNASSLTLASLTAEQSEELLASIFGASPELVPLARRLHALSAGSPRDLMRLSQHLVDRGLARYASGSWSLPQRLDASDIPASAAQLMNERIESVSDSARQLALAFALCPELTFTFDEARQLGAQPTRQALTRDVVQLTRADIIRLREGRLTLTDRAWVTPLTSGAQAELLQSLDSRLAQVFEARGNDKLRQAKHLLNAGATARALDVLTEHAIESRRQTDESPAAFQALLASLPEDWYSIYDRALRACVELDRPKRDSFAIAARLGGITVVKGSDRVHVPAWIESLKQASGLADFEQLDPALEPGVRLQRALQAAGARFQQLSEHDRVVDPKQAIQLLSMGMRFVMSAAAIELDLPLMRTLPSLRPLGALAPAIGVIESLRHGLTSRLSGRVNLALQTYGELLQHLSAPDGGGLDPTHVTYTRLLVTNAVALLEAGMGLQRCLQRAEVLAADDMFRLNAATVRMLYDLWQGDSQGADRERKRIEELRIQSGAQSADQNHLLWQLAACVAMEDLTRLKHALLEMTPLVEQYQGWREVETYGKAEYQRIRGDYTTACELLGPLLGRVSAGEHQMWAQFAAAHVRSLCAVGRGTEAIASGQQYLDAARSAALGPYAEISIVLALSVARANLSQAESGTEIDAAISFAVEAGATGLPLGLMYEARAYVALFQADKQGYERFVELCEQAFTQRNNPALAAKLQRLKREAQRRQFGPVQQVLQGPAGGSGGMTILKSRLSKCHHAAERGVAILTLLAQRSGATQGFLFQMTEAGPTCVATIGDPDPDPMLHPMVQDFIAAETQARDQETGQDESILRTQWTAFGEAKYRHVLLSHYNASGCCVTGIAVFVVKPGQAFSYPGEVAAQVSQMAHELGDATAIIVEEDD